MKKFIHNFFRKNSIFERSSLKSKFEKNGYNKNIDNKIYVTKVPLNVLNISINGDKTSLHMIS